MLRSFALMFLELLIVTTMDLLISKSFSWPLTWHHLALQSRNSIGLSGCMMWMVSECCLIRVLDKCCLLRKWYDWAWGDVSHSALHLLHDGPGQCCHWAGSGDSPAEGWQHLQEDGHQWRWESGEERICEMLPWRQETNKPADTPDTKLKGINCIVWMYETCMITKFYCKHSLFILQNLCAFSCLHGLGGRAACWDYRVI